VASRVVFVDGKPAPHLYRLFNIRSVEGGDDYASMADVVERRFRRLKQSKNKNHSEHKALDEAWSRPDLVVIDGGKGQLGAAISGMKRAGEIVSYGIESSTKQTSSEVIAICAIAKKEEKVFIPHRDEPVNGGLDVASPALLLLRALRDESHRFALNAHRRRRSIHKSS
jgi:excinuclease ABC subunit C